MSSPLAPIAVALDAPDAETATQWAQGVSPYVRCLKVGLEMFCREGPPAVAHIRAAARSVDREDIEIFLDLKLHDIPATVGKAATALVDLNPTYLTVHAAGGADMIAAAATALPATRITAVTVLTSLDAAALAALGLEGSAEDIVVRWARLAVDAGARALVCSPHEVGRVRSTVPKDITLITPGVRPPGSDAGDQRRIATPQAAIADGADLLVIGRPITGQADPGAAAKDLARSLLAGQS